MHGDPFQNFYFCPWISLSEDPQCHEVKPRLTSE